ncbi:MAG: DUF2231 domain-containing protein [Magnetococcales bacterium]|nr:DUF2231 domain-containing protein [Magnetococcales bacterium]
MESITFILEHPAVLHPMVVHFPIAFLVTALFFEFLRFISKKETVKIFAEWMIYLGALSAVVAVGAGWIAAESLGHDSPNHDLVHVHRDIMMTMSTGLILTALALIFFQGFRDGVARKWLLAIVIALTTIMAVGADKGGQLVYKYGVGVNPEIIITPKDSQSSDTSNHVNKNGDNDEDGHSH